MKYEITYKDDVAILSLLESRLIYESLDPIQDKFTSLVDGGLVKFIIDLEKVDYLDSFAVGFIMDMYRRVTNQGGELKLTGLQIRVKKILAITRVDNVIDIHQDVDSAAKSF